MSGMIKGFHSSFISKKMLKICLIILWTCVSLHPTKILHPRKCAESDDLRALVCCHVSSVQMWWVPREIMLQGLLDKTTLWMVVDIYVCAQVGREWQIGVGTSPLVKQYNQFFASVVLHYTCNNILVSVLNWNVELQKCKALGHVTGSGTLFITK